MPLPTFGAARPEIGHKAIASEEHGIQVRYSGFPSTSEGHWPPIVGNAIEGAPTGSGFPDGAGGDIEGDQLTDHEIGISVSGYSDERPPTSITGNVIRGSSTGVQVGGSRSPRVAGNDIGRARRASVLALSSSSPVQTDNVICDNAVNLDVDERSSPQIDASSEIREDSTTEHPGTSGAGPHSGSCPAA